MAFATGRFKPKNPHKYIGKNIDSITYRSSWELDLCNRFDADPRILAWASEPFAIPYMKPCPKSNSGFRPARYFPDFYIEYVDRDNKTRSVVIEVKPHDQTVPPKGKKTKSRILKEQAYAINCMKWKYAKEWCDAHNLEFKIMREKELNYK